MTWMRKVRPLLFVFGGLLVIGSLLGARLLTHGSGGGTDATAAPTDPATGKNGSTIVLGWGDSDPAPVYPGLPPVLQAGEVVKVFVRPGDEVKVRPVTLFGRKIEIGDKLYKFNTQMLDAKLREAEGAVRIANAKLVEARGAVDLHATKVALQERAVDAAETKLKLSHEAWQLGVNNMKEAYRLAGYDPKTWDAKLSNEIKIYELYAVHTQSKLERDLKKDELAGLKTAKEKQVEPLVASAEAEVERYRSLVEEARTAIELCTVRAKVDGTIERVNVSAGTMMGISTRDPAVVLVPSGRRVVRAEVEADFAHRIGKDKIGKKVIIFDNTDPKITYEGVVERIGDTFLPKKSSGDGLVQSDTRVIEALVLVSNPNPSGKYPLRVGQKVRVHFGP